MIEHTLKPPGGKASRGTEAADEGYLKATTASGGNKEHPTASDDLYLHETIAGWDGWSLAAPRPGKRIVEPGQVPRMEPSPGTTRRPATPSRW